MVLYFSYIYTNNCIKLEYHKGRNRIFKVQPLGVFPSIPKYLQRNYILAYTRHCKHENMRLEFNLLLF